MKESYICSDIYLECVKVVKMSKMLTKVEKCVNNIFDNDRNADLYDGPHVPVDSPKPAVMMMTECLATNPK